MHGIEKRIVYVLQTDSNPERHYVGLTNDLPSRLTWHNSGPCGYTVRHRPWSLLVTIEFATEQAALKFERYLKSGSGHAFSRRHFGPV